MIECHVIVRHTLRCKELPITAPCPVSEFRKFATPVGVFYDGISQPPGIAWRNDRAGSRKFDYLRHSPNICNDGGQAGSHSFQNGNRQSLADRGEYKKVSMVEPVANVAPLAQKPH